MSQPKPLIAYDTAYAAMCIMEEICDPNLEGLPWQDFRDTHGIQHLRTVVLEHLAEACDAAWVRAYARYETAIQATGEDVPEPGSFDYEFVPFWLRNCVDWSGTGDYPRVKGNAQQPTTVS